MVTVFPFFFFFSASLYRALSLLFCALSVLTAVSQHVTQADSSPCIRVFVGHLCLQHGKEMFQAGEN